MSFAVLAAGVESRLVDAGRTSTRGFGVPIGGAADRRSWRLGNALVGNASDALALEVALAGPTLRAEHAMHAVVFGAPFVVSTDRGSLVVGKTFDLEPGETLRIGGTPAGVRAYLCVHGGFEGREILGSRSALQPIHVGETLACAESRGRIRSAPLDHPSLRLLDSWTLRVLPGLQRRQFPGAARDFPPLFAASVFRATNASNRMGVRLEGPPIAIPPDEISSEPVCPGTIQTTRDGQCIVLGIDGQTIGGYPKLAQVIQADLDALAQIRPGDEVRFVSCSIQEAEAAFRSREAETREWETRWSA
ncbi:MAG: biotin-dependent carboxyltransferase family protein [Gemmataceae bacterium]|nr:biotin-dependent carboxyltransferase family protein [Gemmataceae bacterium]